MKRTALLFWILTVCSIHTFTQSTELYILGTAHEPTKYINADSIVYAMERVRPDVILCELEAIYFTSDYRLDLDKYPDLLTSSQENMAAYRYQQKTKADLRPYEIEGRNEYYRSTKFFEKQNKMMQDIIQGYQNNTLSPESYMEWDRVTKAILLLDNLDGNKYTLQTINTPLYCIYSEVKELLVYQTFLSITKREFPQWISTAEMILNQVNNRNDVMVKNILKWCSIYHGKKLFVTCGQQHKAQLLNRLKPLETTHNFTIKKIFE